MNKSVIERIEGLEEFLYEAAKIEFAVELNRLLEATGYKKSELADRMGVSRPMISKLLRGDANVTLETMVKAASALGAKLFVKLAAEGTGAHLIDLAKIKGGRAAQPHAHAWVIPANQNECEDEAQPLAA